MFAFKKILKREEESIARALRLELDRLEPVVRPLAEHVIEAGGKRVRPLLTALMGKAFGADGPELYSLACALELLHCATLIHDDVLDAAGTRRGRPAAHKVFGESQAILAGDVLLAATLLIVIRLKDLRLIEKVAETASKTAAGEVEEIQNLRNPDLTFDGYMRIIAGKTAWLLACSSEVGALKAGASPEAAEAARRYGFELGLAFQLVDDALDIAPQSETGKPTGGDLREGKLTPPLYFYLESLEPGARKEFLNRFAGGGLAEPEIEQIVQDMRRLGCAERARSLADQHLKKAQEALALIPAGQERDMLFAIADYVKDRDR